MIIGSNSHSYEVIDLWGKIPQNIKFGTSHGVVEDSQGRIYIHHMGKPSVMVFEADGNYLDGWGDEYSGGAHGLHLNKEKDGEYLYLAATELEFMAKTTLDGKEVFRKADRQIL